MALKQPDLTFLTEQQSVPAKELGLPIPNDSEIELILQAAMSAPDHGELRPFRFLLIADDARQALAEVFEESAIARGLDEAAIAKQKSKPMRSPLIIVVIASLSSNPKIPDIEQMLSAGCAAQHIQLACSALGYGSIWLTGDNAYDINVHEALGMDLNERIIGFMYVGTPVQPAACKSRADARTLTSVWRHKQQKEFAI